MASKKNKNRKAKAKLLFSGRTLCMLLLFGGCYVGLASRLVYLQGVRGASIYEEALKGRTRRFEMDARRGAILDRNNKVLATNLYQGKIVFDYKAVPPPITEKSTPTEKQTYAQFEASKAYIANALNIPLPEVERMVQEGIAKKRRDLLIQKDLKWEVAEKLRKPDWKSVPRKLGEIKIKDDAKLLSFFVKDHTERYYPLGEDGLHVVGMVGEHQDRAHEEFGVMGLELGAEAILRGTNGEAYAEVDLGKREIPGTKTKFSPVAHGLTIHTTIDTGVQQIAMKAAKEIVEKFDPLGVSIVITEPETGDVLAMVSAPSFDPNPLERAKLSSTDIQRAITERCATYQVEPGSTLKTLTLAAALERKVIGSDQWFNCAGSLMAGQKLLHCDSHGGSPVHGDQQPIDILRHSCNVGAAKIGRMMGGGVLRDAMEEFGLCMNSELPVTDMNPDKRFIKSEQGRFNTAKGDLPDGDTARVAFGHAIRTTPIHIANAYAAIANGGTLMKPRLITHLTDSEGRTQKEFKPQPLRRVLSEPVATQVTEMLRAVVARGTGRGASLAGYQLAGKTGTAKKYLNQAKHGLPYVSSFCGFVSSASSGKPRAVVLVLVDEPRKAYYGSEVAVPAFQQIARSLLRDYWHAPEDDPQSTQYAMAHKSSAPKSKPRRTARRVQEPPVAAEAEESPTRSRRTVSH